MRRARRFLLQVRYATELNGMPFEENMLAMGASDRFDPERLAWMRSLAGAIASSISRIDSDISDSLVNWDLERISLLSRLIIEQGIAEVRYMGVPVAVAIDEAVELAKCFESEEAGGLVNGVLDGLLRRRDAPSGPH